MPSEKVKQLSLKITNTTVWIFGIISFLLYILFMYLMSVKFSIETLGDKGAGYNILWSFLILPFLLLLSLKKREFRLAYLFFMSVYTIIMLYLIIKFAI